MQKLDPLAHSGKRRSVVSRAQLPVIIGVYVVLIGLGIGTGYLLTGQSPSSASTATGASSITVNGKKAFGSTDTKTFTDSAVGKIEEGGIDGEGSHKLIRDGGPTQTACLVSSVLDLSQFTGKTVKVWGKTNTAKKCPWLMDVGRVELQ